ncbi:MAG: DUF3105 domain-containing protein [Actinomycetes bacterium]
MAKTKPNKAEPTGGGSRRARLASLEAARKREQRRRTVGLLGICLVLAVALLAYPVYLFVEDYRARNTAITDIGASLAAAACDPAVEAAARGNQDHVPEGTDVPYDRFPPDSGPHYDAPAPFAKHFYGTEDRPEVETLVHNLEHGYTVAWYRDTLPEDAREDLEQISRTFAGDDTYNPQNKFIAAPWTAADGAGFPDGKDVVLTHWYADPNNPGDINSQKGVRQSCATVSGQAIADFMAQYPATASPEPNGV